MWGGCLGKTWVGGAGWQAEPNARALVQGEIPELSDATIHSLQSIQMLCCPRQPRGLGQGKDAVKAEEAQAGAGMTEGYAGVHYE